MYYKAVVEILQLKQWFDADYAVNFGFWMPFLPKQSGVKIQKHIPILDLK